MDVVRLLVMSASRSYQMPLGVNYCRAGCRSCQTSTDPSCLKSEEEFQLANQAALEAEGKECGMSKDRRGGLASLSKNAEG